MEYLDTIPETDTDKYREASRIKSGLAMATLFVNLQEDLFAWMGSETGVISYIAKDHEGEEYLNSAIAILINDKNKAREKINKISGLTRMLSPDINPDKLIECTEYKSYYLDKLHLSQLGIGVAGMTGKDFESAKNALAMLFTDDWLFISDEYGLKQLVDVYVPEGLQDESATFAAYIDWDTFFLHSSRYHGQVKSAADSYVRESEEKELQFDESWKEFEGYIKNRKFGEMKVLKNINPEYVSVHLEITTSTLELIEYIFELSKKIWNADLEVSDNDSEKSVDHELDI